MNINDIDISELPPGDMLYNSLFKQWNLELKYRPIEGDRGFWPQFDNPEVHFPLDLDNAQAQTMIKDAIWRIVEELGEAANCLKNKPWKQTEVATDVTHFIEELMDAWHFMLRLMLLTFGEPDGTAKAVYLFYMKKAAVNEFRQRSKY